MGYDVHRMAEGRKLIIGGVEIPYDRGLLGHSDADVLLHAIMDALLGAASLGDIGKHFPDTDERYRGISSLKLLEQTGQLLIENGWIIENIDATIIAEKPKMRPYIDAMNENIAKTLGIEASRVNVKATTEEGLGFTGSGEGMSAQAICLLSSADDLCSDSVLLADASSDGSVSFRGMCGSCSGCVGISPDGGAGIVSGDAKRNKKPEKNAGKKKREKKTKDKKNIEKKTKDKMNKSKEKKNKDRK